MDRNHGTKTVQCDVQQNELKVSELLLSVINPLFFMIVDRVVSPTRHQSLSAIVTFNVLFTPVVENLDNLVDGQA